MAVTLNARFKTISTQTGVTLPVIQSAEVGQAAANIIVMTYDKALDITSGDAIAQYVSTPSNTLNAATVLGFDVILTYANDFSSSDNVTISYTKGVNPIKDTEGNEAENLVDYPVTNNIDIAQSMAAWWEFSGVGVDENIYGIPKATDGGTRHEVVKDISPAPDYTTSAWGTNAARCFDDRFPQGVSGIATTALVELDIPDLALTGDFTFIAICKHSDSIVTERMIRNNANNEYILTSHTANQLVASGQTATVTYPLSQSIENAPFNMVCKRLGSNYQASIDGGQNYSAPVACFNGTITFQKLVPIKDFIFTRYVIADRDLSQSEIDQIIDYTKNNDVPLVSYVAPTANSLPGHAAVVGNEIPFTDYAFFGNNNVKFQTTVTLGNFSYWITQGSIANNRRDYINEYNHTDNTWAAALLGVDGLDPDEHLISSLIWHNNRLIAVSCNRHYDQQISNAEKPYLIWAPSTGYDMTTFARQPLYKGINRPELAHLRTNYYRFNIFANGTIYQCFQTWYSTSGYIASSNLSITKDAGNYFEYVNIFDGLSSPDDEWIYPALCYGEGVDKLDYFWSVFDPTAGRYTYLCYGHSPGGNDPGYYWENAGNSFNKNVRSRNYLTKADIKANNVLIDASAGSGNANMIDLHYDENNDVYFICGDGNGGWSFGRGNNTGFTIQALTVAGQTLIDSVMSNSGVVLKTGTNQYDAYLTEQGDGTNWTVIQVRTTDNGTSWSFVAKVSQDDANKHVSIVATVVRKGTNAVVRAQKVDSSNVAIGQLVIPITLP